MDLETFLEILLDKKTSFNKKKTMISSYKLHFMRWDDFSSDPRLE